VNVEYKRLDELGTVSRGRSKHRPRNDPSLYGGEYPFIQTAEVKEANLFITDYSQSYNKKGLEQSKLWQPGTLCITIAANIADTAILAIPACFPDSIMGFIPYEDKCDVKYMKYCFDILQMECQQIAEGTAQDNLSWEKLSTIRFPVPDIQKQRRIASILSAYDDLIENNRHQIKLLEEAAQRLYREWFVELRFPGHEGVKIMDGVPEGWSQIPIGKVISYEIGGGWGEESRTDKYSEEAYVIRGTDLKNITHGNYEGFPLRYHTKGNLIARKLVDGDIIFEVSGGGKNEGVARTALIRESLLRSLRKPVICASFCKLIRVADKLYSQYIYDHLQYLRVSGKTEKYNKCSASSIINYRWKDFLIQEEVYIPDVALIQQYNRIMNSIYNKVMIASLQISTARKARDKLLPKLMSGEMEAYP